MPNGEVTLVHISALALSELRQSYRYLSGLANPRQLSHTKSPDTCHPAGTPPPPLAGTHERHWPLHTPAADVFEQLRVDARVPGGDGRGRLLQAAPPALQVVRLTVAGRARSTQGHNKTNEYN